MVTGKRLNEIKREASVEGGEEEDVSLQKKRKELLEFERAQLELKLEYEKKTAEVIKSQKEPSKADNAKLPKLTITKFNGTYEAWLPFWSKFVAEVDSTDLAAVSKFAYLKELIEPKVRINIDGLPFTTEGYARAEKHSSDGIWETVRDSKRIHFEHHDFTSDHGYESTSSRRLLQKACAQRPEFRNNGQIA